MNRHLALTCVETNKYVDLIFNRLNLDAQPARFRVGHVNIGFGPGRTKNAAITAVEVNYPSQVLRFLVFLLIVDIYPPQVRSNQADP